MMETPDTDVIAHNRITFKGDDQFFLSYRNLQKILCIFITTQDYIILTMSDYNSHLT